MFDRHLTDLSVSEFLQAVASAAQPVPAGGSVAALSGAASAALLVLDCDVFERPDVLTQSRQKAAELQQKLLALVDDDAAAFRAFLDTERGSPERQAGGSRVAQIPLDIGRACLEISQVVRSIEPHVAGSMRLECRDRKQHGTGGCAQRP
jgi:formiminotetrahydrofolate cyclodeaminase